MFFFWLLCMRIFVMIVNIMTVFVCFFFSLHHSFYWMFINRYSQLFCVTYIYHVIRRRKVLFPIHIKILNDFKTNHQALSSPSFKWQAFIKSQNWIKTSIYKKKESILVWRLHVVRIKKNACHHPFIQYRHWNELFNSIKSNFLVMIFFLLISLQFWVKTIRK